MEKHTRGILEDFDNNTELFAHFNSKCKTLITDLLRDENILYHQITDRIKGRERLEEKIIRKGNKYSNISEITDICGLRIITYFEDEIDKIAQIIKSTFDVDIINSIDKRQLETDRFGYRSLHYVVSLKNERMKLPEYKKFKNLKVEIQIRTILQHSWAEIEHDIGYKGEFAIPEFAKRTFYRVAALLETADLEFVQLKNTLRNYEDTVSKEIIDNPETVLLDQASLLSYMQTNEKVKEFDDRCAAYTGVEIVEPNIEASANELLKRLKSDGITTIKQLDDIIQTKSEELFNIYKIHTEKIKDNISGISIGMAIYQIDLLKE